MGRRLWWGIAALGAGLGLLAVWWALPDGSAELPVPQASARTWVGMGATALIGVSSVLLASCAPARRQWAVVAAFCGLATILSARGINDEGAIADGVENRKYAVNLVDHGTFGAVKDGSARPNYNREPMPPLVASALVWASRAMGGSLSDADKRAAMDLRAVKCANLPWIFAGLMSTWWLAWLLCRSHAAGALASWIAWICLFTQQRHLNSLMTEIQGGTMIAASSLALVMMVRSRRLHASVAAGLAVGVLCLTKAIFLPMAVTAWLLVAVPSAAGWATGRGRSCRQWLLGSSVALITTVAVVAPWMLRNKIQFDAWAISTRGSHVLLIRALKNQMTAEEWVGALWYWGPSVYRDLVEGTPLAATQQDFELGGRLQRLSRSKANTDVSFYRQSYVTARALEAEYRRAQSHSPTRDTDNEMKRRAVSMIRDDLGSHLWCTVPFTWRGIWMVVLKSEFAPAMAEGGTAAVASAALWLSLVMAFAAGLWRRSGPLIAATLLPMMSLAAYALLTHNIPRYTAPLIPVMSVTLSVGLVWMVRAARRWLSAGRAAAMASEPAA